MPDDGGVSIHSEHPFATPEGDRDALRRLRGRLPAPVTLWTTGVGRERAGLTVSSMMIADGAPAHLLGLVDEDSDLADAVLRTRTVAVSVATWDQRALGDAFAGTSPAPGGPFTLGSWTQTGYGPVLDGAVGWLGARMVDDEPRHAGWALLLDAVVEHVEIGDPDAEAVVHVRGRYRRP